jgi:putative addiction module component (TIGR02574 family)
LDATLEQLQAAVLSLPEAERARLAERLLASLEEDPQVEAAWRGEVRDRLDAYRQGALSAVSADDVLSKARRIVGR